ncbi:hypothetical protein [Rhizobium bangladeshense]|uniref:hypothetical protein n=1 Tax=Rhizobium bangladeshense TaxID=1138189 RepID=UPI0007E55EC7|nr:hypothetical protein [Rhizobium bangladeshense]
MILSQIFQAQTVLNDAEVALCQRVFDQVVLLKQIKTDIERQDLASRIIHSYQQGVKDEGTLLKLMI